MGGTALSEGKKRQPGLVTSGGRGGGGLTLTETKKALGGGTRAKKNYDWHGGGSERIILPMRIVGDRLYAAVSKNKKELGKFFCKRGTSPQRDEEGGGGHF